jgi:hypothetical protein
MVDDQNDYEWQQAYPTDLTQYLAVRLWYERELVEKNCLKELGVSGNFDTISAYMKNQPNAYSLKLKRVAGHLPADYTAMIDRLRYTGLRYETKKNSWNSLADRFASEYGPRRDQGARRAAAWRLYHLAKNLKIHTAGLIEAPPEDLKTLLD